MKSGRQMGHTCRLSMANSAWVLKSRTRATRCSGTSSVSVTSSDCLIMPSARYTLPGTKHTHTHTHAHTHTRTHAHTHMHIQVRRGSR